MVLIGADSYTDPMISPAMAPIMSVFSSVEAGSARAARAGTRPQPNAVPHQSLIQPIQRAARCRIFSNAAPGYQERLRR